MSTDASTRALRVSAGNGQAADSTGLVFNAGKTYDPAAGREWIAVGIGVDNGSSHYGRIIRVRGGERDVASSEEEVLIVCTRAYDDLLAGAAEEQGLLNTRNVVWHIPLNGRIGDVWIGVAHEFNTVRDSVVIAVRVVRVLRLGYVGEPVAVGVHRGPEFITTHIYLRSGQAGVAISVGTWKLHRVEEVAVIDTRRGGAQMVITFHPEVVTFVPQNVAVIPVARA